MDIAQGVIMIWMLGLIATISSFGLGLITGYVLGKKDRHVQTF